MKKILVVDDNEANLTMINQLLSGLYKVYPVSSGEDALEYLGAQLPDLILLDVKMPGISGIDLIKMLKTDKNLRDIPVIFLTVLTDTDNEALALDLGAVDYIRKPLNSAVMLARVKLHLELESYRRELQELVEIKTREIIQREQITIGLLSRVNEFRDNETGDHVKRAVGYVSAIMDNLPGNLPRSYHISRAYYDDIKRSTPLHDIGKISIPDSILLKPGRLSDEEFEIMKTHVINGAKLLEDAIKEFSGHSFLDAAMELVLTHHEKWDGSGYPNGLSGEDIPISGRIMAVADVYDALTSKRPYKPAFSHEKALAIMSEESGSHFDPVLIEVFTRIQDDILKISGQYKSSEE